MRKETTKNLGQLLCDVTLQTSDIYIKTSGKKKIDKQMWAFLAIGFTSALKLYGWNKKEIEEIITVSQKELENLQK